MTKRRNLYECSLNKMSDGEIFRELERVSIVYIQSKNSINKEIKKRRLNLKSLNSKNHA